MRGIRKSLAAVCVAAAVMVGIVACGSDDDGGASQEGGTAAAAGFPVTIKHAFGSTTIPAEPKKIIALSYEEDTLAALGITPIAYGQNPDKPDGDFPWLEGRIDLADSTALDTSGDLNLEQIAALDPDLILATNFYGLADYYDRLSEIAPTVAYETDAGISTWQDVSTVIGKAVGREADVAKAIEATEKIVSDAAAELPGLAGKTFSYSYYYESNGLAVIDDPETISIQLYGQLGMKLSPRVTASVVDRALSMEKIGELDADFMMIGFATDELRTEMKANELYTRIPAVVDGRAQEVDAFTAGAVNNPTILNIPWQLEQLKPTLAKVAAAG
ncbi:iron-siderophore ABC transporter substrate-binding protein [Parafrankia sp. BMG5.11]|nr:iron-siderophore ABC transporter substrate-binding protein [Parafrankia sp. BMG5.11]